MNLAVESPTWLVAILVVLLLAAAAQDAARLKISNITVGFVLIAAVAAAIVLGLEVRLWQNLVVFVVLLAIGTPLFAAGKLGGGDVKLLAAIGLWFDISGALSMLLAVALAGGLLAILILLLRPFGWSDRVRGRVAMLQRDGGIPYGVAIAAGALVTMMLQRS